MAIVMMMVGRGARGSPIAGSLIRGYTVCRTPAINIFILNKTILFVRNTLHQGMGVTQTRR